MPPRRKWRLLTRRRRTPTIPGRRRTRKGREEEAVEGDEKEKLGQEKGCYCLLSFALWCGQFQAPSPHQICFVLGAGNTKLA